MFKNKHFNAILTKFLLVVTVLGLLLPPIAKVSTVTAVFVAFSFTFAAYALADLLVLALFGNRAAVFTDVLLVMLMTWEIVNLMENQTVPIPGLLIIGFLIGCGEWFYHQRYLSGLLYQGRVKP